MTVEKELILEKSKTFLQVEGIELNTGPHFMGWSIKTRDLSQAEKKITVVTSWATDKMTSSTILIKIYVILCNGSACNNIYFLLS